MKCADSRTVFEDQQQESRSQKRDVHVIKTGEKWNSVWGSAQAYFGDDFLLRRHDYRVDVAGGFPTAQYVHNIVNVEGLRYPTKRFAYVRGPNLKTIRDLLLVSIALSSFRFTT